MDKFKIGDIIWDTTIHEYSPILVVSQEELEKHSIHIIPPNNYGYKTHENYYSSGHKKHYDRYELMPPMAVQLYFKGS